MSRHAGCGRAAWAACGLLLMMAVLGAGADAAEPTRQAAVLDLPGEGFLLGRLVPAAAAADGPRTSLLWQAPEFVQPLEFAVDGIERIRFPKRPAAAAPADAWRVEMHGGEFATGTLEAIDDAHVVLAVADVGGPLRIRREAIRRMSRSAAAARTIVPGGLAGWNARRGGWQEQGGRLVCDTPGGTASRDVGAGPRACFDVVLSWDERPEFELFFGIGAEAAARLEAAAGGGPSTAMEEYRLELTAGDLLAIREGVQAKFDLVGSVPAGAGELRLRVFVDQGSGRLAVVLPAADAAAKPAFDETLAPRRPGNGPGFRIRVRSGGVRIEGLRVAEWTDAEPRLAPPGGLGRPDARLESFARSRGEFVVRDAVGSRAVPEDSVTEIEFPALAPAATWPAASMLAVFHDGTRLRGRILEVTPTAVRMECPALADRLDCELATLAVLESVGSGGPAAVAGRAGVLEAAGCRMAGCLASGPGQRGIAWQPRGAVGPVVIDAATAPLRIAYRNPGTLGGVGVGFAKMGQAWVVADVTPGGPAARSGRIRQQMRLAAIRLDGSARPIDAPPLGPDEIRGLLRGPAGSTVHLLFADPAGNAQEVSLVRDASGRGDLAGAAESDVLVKALQIQEARLAPVVDGQAAVFLKTGDSILCTVLGAGPDGVRIKTDTMPDVLVPAVAVRAVELVPASGRPISRGKFARLLTLPRMQQADPPTHVLRLAGGDYLRGKLLAVDDRVVRMNVMGATQEIPRSEATRLIWLSVAGDDSEAAALRAVVAGLDGAGVPARATLVDGRTLTFAAQRVEGDRLVGLSGVFGTTGIELARCSLLELGPEATATVSRDLPYGQWKLEPAAPPRALGKASTAAPGPATVHPLAGKAAAPLALPLLEPAADGRPWIAAADADGRIAVHCLFAPADGASVAALPGLAAALAPLADEGVVFTAVAVGAAREAVAQAVAGRGPQPPIALDQAGNLHALLGKPALPACLIVDRDGRVADVLPPADGGEQVRRRVERLVQESRAMAGEFEALRRARDLAVAGDRGCLELLGGLLDATSETVRRRAGGLLRRMTGLPPQDLPYRPELPSQQRAEQVRRWRRWLAVEGISADLRFPQPAEADWSAARPIAGRTLVCRPSEQDVVELDADGRQTFQAAVQGGWACDALPDGHRLVGDHLGNAVVEYDAGGAEVWAVRNLPGGPMSARRLDTGNTLVALSDANLVAEYDPQGKIAWSVRVEGRPCDARRLADGTTLVAAHRAGRIVELDPAGAETWAVEGLEDPQTAQRLPNGNTLVAMSVPGIVREIDRAGRVVWQKEGLRVPTDVQRLPDGTTLVQEQDGALIEFDPDGAEIRRTSTRGSRFLRW